MEADEQDKLWELMGRAKQPEVSPFFSRNILREIRQEPQGNEFGARVIAWFSNRWRSAALVSACAVVALTATHFVEKPDTTVAMARNVKTTQDFEVISNLDDLLAYEDNSVWADSGNSVF